MIKNTEIKVSSPFAGQVAVVAGGGSPGMGRATAVLLAEFGADVAILDINLDTAEESAERIRSVGGNAIALQVDMTDADAVQASMAQCVNNFGRIDLLFNNTGVPASPQKMLADFEPDEWDKCINLNLRSIFLGMKYAIPHILKAGGGAIVNNASVSGLRANVGGAPYGVAKAGVIHLTKIAALEYGGKGIRVNAICPYSISRKESNNQQILESRYLPNLETLEPLQLDKWKRAQLPMLRSGKGFEVANAVKFLLSEDASWISGAALPVDGASAAGYFGSFR
jgi:NAD(P)-dependent dehydrogenase (short-subunit alcohol dehydrogenase family)